MSSLYDATYNPDILTCLANLSSDEVFTPPTVANQMLDMLPQELFKNPDTKFLDPGCKSGVFLREIAKRLIEGEQAIYPELNERINHIMHEQLYGIATTELTSMMSRRSLYCSKYPNGPFSITKFDTVDGNIRFKNLRHSWENGKCKFCGASKDQYDRDSSLESHAYEFIHTLNPEEIWKMKFDVVISNPPYQLSDGGHSNSATPIYQHFVEQAEKLNPRYLTMIIPSRWFTGGRGLQEFRTMMLHDKKVRKLVDYENYREIFPGLGGLAGGACYFLWDRDHEGPCDVTNVNNGQMNTVTRKLDEYSVFVRSNTAIPIVRKVQSIHHGIFMNETVFPSKPFGLRTFYEPKETGIPCQFIQKYGLKFADPADVTDSYHILDKWKLVAPRSPIAGQTDFTKPVRFYYDGNINILAPGTCCTESCVVLFASDTREEVESFKSYLYTKTVRFLLLQCAISQDMTREKFTFVPALDKYQGTYTDEMLCKQWKITKDEWDFIDSKVASAYDGGDE